MAVSVGRTSGTQAFGQQGSGMLPHPAKGRPNCMAQFAADFDANQTRPGQRELETPAWTEDFVLSSLRIEDWDDEAFCAGVVAKDRAIWCFNHRGMEMDAARLRVMNEFPSQFGHRLRDVEEEPSVEPALEQASTHSRELAAGVPAKVPVMEKSSSGSSLKTTFTEDQEYQSECSLLSEPLEEARQRVIREAQIQQDSTQGRSELSEARVQALEGDLCSSSCAIWSENWDGEAFCEGRTANDIATEKVETCALPLDQARLRVMQEFPNYFGLPVSLMPTAVSEVSSGGESSHLARSLARNVPKAHNFAEEFSKTHGEEAQAAPPTTMMIRNVPNRYKQQDLLAEIEALGFAGAFDFLYAPIDFSSWGNMGYAFINFVNNESAMRFQKELEGYAFMKFQQKLRPKLATVSVAHLQGLEANMSHYETSRVTGRARLKRVGPFIVPSNSDAAHQLCSEGPQTA